MAGAHLFFELKATLLSPLPSAELVAVGVDFSHRAVSLWKAGSRHVASFGASGSEAVQVDSIGVRFPRIDVLPGNRILICDSRTNGDSPNGWIFSEDGALLAEGGVGDGIAHVLATSSGAIWIGYFDEGVFGLGDYGPHGIVRLNDDLTLGWTYPISSSIPEISDCYTLNVDGETAMSCFYTDFPIVHIVGETVSSWTGAPSGAHGLLRASDAVLLFGGYAEHRDRVVRLRLRADGSAEEAGIGRIIGLPEGRPFTPICRGSEAHVFVESSWYRASL